MYGVANVARAGSIPGAINLPLEELRERNAELEEGRQVWVYCRVGQRAYYATRLLVQRGIDAANLPGGIETYRAFLEAQAHMRPADR